MTKIKEADRLQFHYYFNDASHSIDSVIRNEAEKEILSIFEETSETLGLKLKLESSPAKEGGFIDIWNFIGENSGQITLLVSVAAIIISRFPTKNKELTPLQIENLKLDNELKRKKLEQLNLDFIQNSEQVNEKVIIDAVKLALKNYKISWHKSNLYKQIDSYNKVVNIDVLRKNGDSTVGKPRVVNKKDFKKFILKSDELPDVEVKDAKIDVISPALKSGKFRWKGFYKKQIINFLMNDFNFKNKVWQGGIQFSNNFSITANMTQERKIDRDGGIKITNSIVSEVTSYPE